MSKSTAPHPLNLDNFKIERSICEVRYSHAMLHWDKAGTLWNRIFRQFPEMEAGEGTPYQTTFILNRQHELSAGIERAALISHFPQRSLSDFIELAEALLSSVVTVLEVSAFSRVGLRLVFSKELGSEEEAARVMFNTKLIKEPEGPIFGIVGTANHPEYAVRWEGENNGASVRIKAEGRILNFRPPINVPDLKPIHETKHFIIYDVDLFTMNPVPVSSFSPTDWIKNQLHLAFRDGGKFL